MCSEFDNREISLLLCSGIYLQLMLFSNTNPSILSQTLLPVTGLTAYAAFASSAALTAFTVFTARTTLTAPTTLTAYTCSR